MWFDYCRCLWYIARTCESISKPLSTQRSRRFLTSFLSNDYFNLRRYKCSLLWLTLRFKSFHMPFRKTNLFYPESLWKWQIHFARSNSDLLQFKSTHLLIERRHLLTRSKNCTILARLLLIACSPSSMIYNLNLKIFLF